MMYHIISYCASSEEAARAQTAHYYTQFAIQDSGLFGPNLWRILAPPSNYLSKKVSGQPNPWNKSWIVNYCCANWVYLVAK